MRPRQQPDAVVIDAFVAHLCENGHPGLEVEFRPDDCDRNDPAPDAVAGRFVIEHTSIDTIANQRKDSANFEHLTSPLAKELRGRLPYRLTIALPHREVAGLRGRRMDEIRDALRSWIVNDSRMLEDGVHRVVAIGVPFSFHAVMGSTRPSGLFFGRAIDDPESDDAGLREKLAMKVAKLVAYDYPDKITILLVESSDLALMNEVLATDMIGSALGWGRPRRLDRVWFVDTSLANEFVFTDLTERLGADESRGHDGASGV